MAKKKRKSKASFMRKCVAGVKRAGTIATSSARATCAALAKGRKGKRRKRRG